MAKVGRDRFRELALGMGTTQAALTMLQEAANNGRSDSFFVAFFAHSPLICAAAALLLLFPSINSLAAPPHLLYVTLSAGCASRTCTSSRPGSASWRKLSACSSRRTASASSSRPSRRPPSRQCCCSRRSRSPTRRRLASRRTSRGSTRRGRLTSSRKARSSSSLRVLSCAFLTFPRLLQCPQRERSTENTTTTFATPTHSTTRFV